mmetsp:Transcript_6742/g.16283  ORF Transcript_6742/g.16283 Transcript_6742/m.16283 type:complete len:246 (-) Transcript_6742:892-1629(-)
MYRLNDSLSLPPGGGGGIACSTTSWRTASRIKPVASRSCMPPSPSWSWRSAITSSGDLFAAVSNRSSRLSPRLAGSCAAMCTGVTMHTLVGVRITSSECRWRSARCASQPHTGPDGPMSHSRAPASWTPPALRTERSSRPVVTCRFGSAPNAPGTVGGRRRTRASRVDASEGSSWAGRDAVRSRSKKECTDAFVVSCIPITWTEASVHFPLFPHALSSCIPTSFTAPPISRRDRATCISAPAPTV